MKTITTEVHIDASPTEVWAVLTDFAAHEEWNPFFASIEGEPVVGSKLKIAARKKDGSAGMRFAPTVLESIPGEILRWKGKLFVPGIFDGTHEFLLEESDGGTLLTHGESFRGLLVPLVGKVLRDTHDGFIAFNEALKDRVEARVAEPCQS